MIRRIRPVILTDRIESEIRRVIGEVLGGRERWPEYACGWVPLIDIYERDDELVVEAEVPGFSAGDVVVSLDSGRIELRGFKRKAAAEHRPRYVRLERESGPFQRTVPLPCAVRPDRAKAVLANGVLTVRMKKWRESRNRQIAVKSPDGGD
jgi:HSP20 family protein